MMRTPLSNIQQPFSVQIQLVLVFITRNVEELTRITRLIHAETVWASFFSHPLALWAGLVRCLTCLRGTGAKIEIPRRIVYKMYK